MSAKRRWLPFLVAGTLAASSLSVEAQSRTVVVQNDSKNTIYKLFAWPSDLVPRTYNVLPLPLKPNDQKAVDLENVYGDCYFTFQADLTTPLPKKRTAVRRPKVKPILRVLERVDLCDPKMEVIFR